MNQGSARAVLAEAMENPHSDFYHRKYAHVPDIASRDWASVPFLTREELQAVPLRDRLGVPWCNVEIIRPTSGTSGAGILLMPRAEGGGDFTSPLHRTLYEVQRIRRLATMSGAHFRHESSYRRSLGIQSIGLDAGDLDAACSLIRAFKPDMLAGFAYGIAQLGPVLAAEGLATSITLVEIFGEWCTGLQWRELHELFPNAKIVTTYASIDIQAVAGVACGVIMDAREQAVHIVPEYAYGEIVNPDTGQVITEEGAAGELVLTMLRPGAFPIIRYRTGDCARIIRSHCACGSESPVLALEGRMAPDRIRIAGGELNIAEIDRVLMECDQYVEGVDFEAVYVETESESPRMRLYVAWRTDMIDVDAFAQLVETQLRIAPSRTYADHVRDGILSPVEIVYRTPLPGAGKRVRLSRASA